MYSAYIMAALSVLLIGLSLNVSRLRLAHKISFGDGGIKELTAAVRAHGNTLEQSLLFMLLLYLAESSTAASANMVLILGLVFLAVRLLHAAALFGRLLLVRQVAHVTTLVLQIAVILIILAPLAGAPLASLAR